ncbi:MAG: DUF4252 domain-containing protein [Cryomorphaceae bacterium]|nr:DUF4252 domain-containing protein [Cryomorphaceae bacterium]
MRIYVTVFLLLALCHMGRAQSKVTRAQLDADALAMESYYAQRNEAWSKTGEGMDPDSIPKPVVFTSSFFYPSTLRVILQTDDAMLNAMINKIQELAFLKCDEIGFEAATDIYQKFSDGLSAEGYTLLADANLARQWLGSELQHGRIYGVVKNGNIKQCVMMVHFPDQPFYIADFTGDISFDSLVKLMSNDLPGIFSKIDPSFLKSLSGQ